MDIKPAPLPNAATHPHLYRVDTAFIVNEKYLVYLNITGRDDELVHLRIRRLDDKPITNFAFLQEVKNKLLGENVVAIQVFPKTEDYIDNSNTYHLFVVQEFEAPNLKKLYFYRKKVKNEL